MSLISNKPVGWGGSGVRTNHPHAGGGLLVRAVSGRGQIAEPWDAESRKSERRNEQLEPETIPTAKKEGQ